MLFYVASLATGIIFAENLTGEGSARRWAESRGLTFDSLQTDEELAVIRARADAWIVKLRQMLPCSSPDVVVWIQREIDLYSTPHIRGLYVKEDVCPMAEIFVGDGRWASTYDFADSV